MLPIFELIMNGEEDGVSLVSFVDSPAMKSNWVAFSDIKEELFSIQSKQEQLMSEKIFFSDYPKSAISNAKRAIKHKEENGSDCGTQVGWIRARQIAQGKSFDESMIKRIYSFLSRAKTYDQGKYTDDDGNEICGSIMYDAWGGDSMKTWAESKLNQLERKRESMSRQEYAFQIQSEEKRIVSGAILLADFPVLRVDEEGKPYYVVLRRDTIEKVMQKFFKEGRHIGSNKDHNKEDMVQNAYMFESYMIDRERGVNPPKGFEFAKDGSWFGSYKIDDEETWIEAKSGKFNGFSIEGAFEMKPVEFAEEQNKEAELLSALKQLESALYKQN